MTTVELYSKGAQIWIPSEDAVWQLAVLHDDYDGGQSLNIQLNDGSVRTLRVTSENDLPPLRNPEIFQGVSDLTQLSYLHEPAVLHNLKLRFMEHNAIYTYCGIVLVAINPYQELSIYGQDTMETYRGCSMGELDPHIFAIAEEAFTKMEREDRDQSIIVSGESGAGKTVSAKYAMRYFAAANGSSTETNVEKRVLATNPIMEAIGNAKTTRNDNSSRFGKFIEIDFDKHFTIIGAKMRTYLLEKSRVVFQSPEERNYHIFYQLCAAAQNDAKTFGHLQLGSAEEHRYTNQGGNVIIDGVDDVDSFRETISAMQTLSFLHDDQTVILRILAAILHLGDVALIMLDQDSSAIVAGDTHLPIFAQLLGIDSAQMSLWMTKRRIVTGKEQMFKALRLQEAEAGRDAFAKHMYARLFNWIVSHVNRKLVPGKQPHHFIGVLDIYGFEVFAVNSFEQFCINYANEKLQQQFVIHVFKLEQEEYVREEIQWTMIDYFDNQPCIDLIESKLGILDLLDEECKMPKGSDQTWCTKLINTSKEREKSTDHKSWKYFEKPRFSQESFIIVHFADKVEYDCNGFLDKNRDTMNEEFVNLLRASEYPLVAQLFQEANEKLTGGKSTEKNLKPVVSSTKNVPQKPGIAHKTHTQSVGSQFQDSLKALMDTLNRTTPHYVRCIKPNDDKVAFSFDPKRAIQQLRACGVLETIRISAAGFPTRWTYKDFFVRYRVMCRSTEINRTNIRKTVEIIVTKLISDGDKYKFGKSMVFFRAGQVAYMEKLRSDRRMACGLTIQKTLRGWKDRKKYVAIRRSALLIQTAARGYLARKHYKFLKETAAAIKIQSVFRGFVQRKRFGYLKQTAIAMQALARGCAARRRYIAKVRQQKATVIQRHVRGFLARRRYQKKMRQIILVQSVVRRHFAKKQLRALKIEARNVDHIRNLNKGLENKIISLQQRLDEQHAELVQKRRFEEEAVHLRQKLTVLGVLETEIHSKNLTLSRLEQTIRELQAEIAAQKHTADSLNSEVGRLNAALSEKDQSLTDLQTKHANEMERLQLENHALHEVSRNQSEALKKEYDVIMDNMRKEISDERDDHQFVTDELNRVKQRLRNFEDVKMLKGHQRTPSDVSSGSQVSSDTTSTVYVGDEGYSTGKTEPTKRSPHDGWTPTTSLNHPPDDYLNSLKFPIHGFEDQTEELQNLRIEYDKVKHLLEMRPLMDESVSERVHRQFEENLRFRQFVFKSQHKLIGEFGHREKLEMLEEIKQLLEPTYGTDVTSHIPNVVVEDVSTLDSASLNLLFLSLREALAIQAIETSQILSGRNIVCNQYEMILKENQCFKTILSRMTGDNSTLDALKHVIVDAGQRLQQNEVLMKENRSLKSKLKKLDRNAENGTDKSTQNGFHHEPDVLSNQDDSMLPHLPDRQLMGIIQFPHSEMDHFIKSVVGIPPRVASNCKVPALPAFLIFMTVRHTDLKNDDKSVKELLANTKREIESCLKRNNESASHFALWLQNTRRLIDLLLQYGGNAQYQLENSTKQNLHCLREFDLSQYQLVFEDLSISIYRALVALMQKAIKDDAAKAIIEFESALGVQQTGTTMKRWRTKKPAECHASLYEKLNEFYTLVTQEHALDPLLIKQIFRQLMYYLSMFSVNFLMQSQKHCTILNGIQIKANISNIQDWVRSHSSVLPFDEVMSGMAAITECATLLQAKKSEEKDIDEFVACAKVLSNAQILRLAMNFHTSEEYDIISKAALAKLKLVVAKRTDPDSPGVTPSSSSFTLSTDYLFPVNFPYSPSKIELDTIQIPSVLNLNFIRLY